MLYSDMNIFTLVLRLFFFFLLDIDSTAIALIMTFFNFTVSICHYKIRTILTIVTFRALKVL